MQKQNEIKPTPKQHITARITLGNILRLKRLAAINRRSFGFMLDEALSIALPKLEKRP
jgi:hypothetical protein